MTWKFIFFPNRRRFSCEVMKAAEEWSRLHRRTRVLGQMCISDYHISELKGLRSASLWNPIVLFMWMNGH